MRDSRSKSAYLVEVAVREIVRRFPEPILATFTFRENITDIAEAKRRWRPLADWIRRHRVVGVGAWQRQARGAWHCHLALSKRLDILTLRAFAEDRGWGSFINLRPIQREDSHQVDKAARYISRYVSRDNAGADWGVGLTIYVGQGARRGTVKYSWTGGLAGVYRAGVNLYWQLYHERPNTWGDGQVMDLVMRLGLEEVLGLPSYEGIERHPRFTGAGLSPPNPDDPF